MNITSIHTPESTGVICLNGRDVFYKCLDRQNFQREFKGYKFLSQYYPTAELLGAHLINDSIGILLFKYEDTIGQNRGLLLDHFAYNRPLNSTITAIFDLYRSVFAKTLALDTGAAADIFFANRAHSRLPQFYRSSFINSVRGQRLSLNQHILTVQLGDDIASITAFFRRKKPTWCVAGQADPHDLNIGLKPIIFDYLAGGMVPLMAEFATLVWYNLIAANYLAIRYHPTAFDKHDQIIASLDSVISTKDTITHTIQDIRKSYINAYIDQVVTPVMNQIPYYPNWYNEFKNYFAMKVLGVWNIALMNETDRNLSLAYLDLFYNRSKISNLQDLKTLITTL